MVRSQGGDHREAAAEVGRDLHPGLGDGDHRTAGQLPRGVQSRIAEAGQHVPVDAVPFTAGDLVQHARHGQRLVVVALDRGRTHADGLTASIVVPTAATRRADSPIFSVIDAVVLGLMTLINIASALPFRTAQDRPVPQSRLRRHRQASNA